MDDRIREAIRAAEAAAPHVPFSFRVVREASLPADLDRKNYEEIRLRLGGVRRERLDRDFRIWEATKEHFAGIRGVLADEAGGLGDSPVYSRLLRISVRPPRNWIICRECNGKGDGDVGYCRVCQGHGWKT